MVKGSCLCGAITYEVELIPDKNLYFSVCLSTIDTPLDCKPVAHLNTESKASWCTPDAGIPAFAGIPEGIV